MRTRHRLAAPVIAALIVAGGCGNDDDNGAAPEPAGSGSVAGGTEQVDPAGPDADGNYPLHPDLADIPLPDGYTVPVEASAYSAAEDPRATVTQNVYLVESPDDATAFFLGALPDAGFTLDEGATGGLIFFENPDGVPGQLTVMPLPDGGSNVIINLHRGG